MQPANAAKVRAQSGRRGSIRCRPVGSGRAEGHGAASTGPSASTAGASSRVPTATGPPAAGGQQQGDEQHAGGQYGTGPQQGGPSTGGPQAAAPVGVASQSGGAQRRQSSMFQSSVPSRRRPVRGGPVGRFRAVRHRPALRRRPADGAGRRPGQRLRRMRTTATTTTVTTTRATTTRATPRLAARSRFRPGLSSRADSVTGDIRSTARPPNTAMPPRAGQAEQTPTAGYGAPAGQFAETAPALSAPVPADAASGDQWSPNGAQPRQPTARTRPTDLASPSPERPGRPPADGAQAGYQQPG